jgi:hypothetical protein
MLASNESLKITLLFISKMILLTESQLKLLVERQGDLDFIKTSNEIFNTLLKFTNSLDEIKKDGLLRNALANFQIKFPEISLETKRRNQKIADIILKYSINTEDYFDEFENKELSFEIYFITNKFRSYGVYDEQGIIKIYCEMNSFKDSFSEALLKRKGSFSHELKHFYDDQKTNFKASSNYQYAPSRLVKGREKDLMTKKYYNQPFEKNAFFTAILDKTIETYDSLKDKYDTKNEAIKATYNELEDYMESLYDDGYFSADIKRYMLSRLYTSLEKL